MPTIVSQTVIENGIEYVFELEVKEIAASILKRVDGMESFQIGLVAKSRAVTVPDQPPEPWTPIAAEIDFRFTDRQAEAVVSIEGDEVARIPLHKLKLAEETDEDEVAALIDAFFAKEDLTGFDTVIQAIPTDPVLGCILKSGISASIRQVTLCYDANKREETVLAVAAATLKCVGTNAGLVMMRMTGRTFRCAMFGGWA
ncbi:MAG: hypothetical protein AAFW87_07610 [Pseudomonadota bacterium]